MKRGGNCRNDDSTRAGPRRVSQWNPARDCFSIRVMSSPDLSTEAESEPRPGDLIEVGTYATPADAFQHSLVVLAMGWACWLLPADDGRIRLLVEPTAARSAWEQLGRFDHESLHWPPPPLEAGEVPRLTDFLSPLFWSLGVIAVYWGQVTWPAWTGAGALDAEAVFTRHEWWRPATALFLHADADHLVSNGFSGILVFTAVLATLGRARGWGLLALSSVAGNFAVAAMNYPAAYRSLGASTAIFAGLGLLTGRAIRIVVRADHPHRWRSVFVPLAAGLTVLGLYGAGGIHIDVLAHVTGFGAGLLIGFCAVAPSAKRRAA